MLERYPGLELEQAARFLQIGRKLLAEKQSIRSVAKRLEAEGIDGCSPPNLTRLIKDLNKLTGKVLIVADGQGRGARLELTDAGRVFIGVCVERVAQEIDGLPTGLGERVETIRIATHHMFSTYFLPQAILQYLEEDQTLPRTADEPRTRVNFAIRDITNLAQGIEYLREDYTDLVIDCPPLILRPENVVVVDYEFAFFRVVMVPKDGKGSALLPRGRISLRDLSTVPLCYVLSGDLAGSLPRTLESRASVDSLSAVREFVKKGFVGLTLNWEPLLWSETESDCGTEIKWPESKPETERVTAALQAMAAYRNFPPASPALLHFVQVVGDVFRKQKLLMPPRDILRKAKPEARKSYLAAASKSKKS